MTKSSKKNKSNNNFLIICFCSIVFLLLLCVLGVNTSSLKGTSAATIYDTLWACAVQRFDYISNDKKCASGVVVEAGGILGQQGCCPSDSYTYSASGHCTRYYASTVEESVAKADCERYENATYYPSNKQCSIANVPKPSTYCINGGVETNDCCPAGYKKSNVTTYCVKDGWTLVYDELGTQYNLGAGYICKGTVSSSSSSSSKPSSSSSSSKPSSSSSDTTTCDPGEYYNRGACYECQKNYYCPGGTFHHSTSHREGMEACPTNTTSLAGSDDKSDCKANVCVCFDVTVGTGQDCDWLSFYDPEVKAGIESEDPSSDCGGTLSKICYKCDDGYLWKAAGEISPGDNCTPATSYTDQTSCEAANESLKACYKCTNGYRWILESQVSANEQCEKIEGVDTPAACENANYCTKTYRNCSVSVMQTDCDGLSSIGYGSTFIDKSKEGLAITGTCKYRKNVTDGCDEPIMNCAASSSSSKPSSSTPQYDPPSSTPQYDPPSSTPQYDPPSSSEVTTPSSSSQVQENPTSSDDENVSDNPQTGNIAMFIVWVLALGSMVYSVWYFKKIKEN